MLNINLNNPIEIRTVGMQDLWEWCGLCSNLIWDMEITQRKDKMNRMRILTKLMLC